MTAQKRQTLDEIALYFEVFTTDADFNDRVTNAMECYATEMMEMVKAQNHKELLDDLIFSLSTMLTPESDIDYQIGIIEAMQLVKSKLK